MNQSVAFGIFIIFGGSAILATLALYTRQSLLVAYIVIGCILGPSCLGVIANGKTLQNAGAIGIFFLLFLLGLDLQPKKFLHVLKKTAPVTLIGSVIFMLAGYLLCLLFGFGQLESLIVGVAMMFSSTIIGLKLLPTTILHHRHTGEIMISILLSQDLIAIVVLVLLTGFNHTEGFSWIEFVELGVAFPALLGFTFLAERYILTPCLRKFDTTHEYVFLLSVGWCLGIAQLAHAIGLSEEIGAFVAGVMLADSPVAHYIVDSLKPLRDFFLVMFFFSIGAEFDFSYLPQIYVPAILLGGLMLVLKPFTFNKFLQLTKESPDVSLEVGVRLGQGSEFALLLITVALQATMISLKTAYLVQAAMILTFIVSSYWVVLKYPTPLSFNTQMRKD